MFGIRLSIKSRRRSEVKKIPGAYHEHQRTRSDFLDPATNAALQHIDLADVSGGEQHFATKADMEIVASYLLQAHTFSDTSMGLPSSRKTRDASAIEGGTNVHTTRYASRAFTPCTCTEHTCKGRFAGVLPFTGVLLRSGLPQKIEKLLCRVFFPFLSLLSRSVFKFHVAW